MSEKNIIRWFSSELAEDCCHNYYGSIGQLVTSYQDDSIECVVSLLPSTENAFIVFHIEILNKSEKFFTVRPSDFSIRVAEPVNEIYNALDVKTVCEQLQRGENLRPFLSRTIAGKTNKKLSAARDHALPLQTVFKGETVGGVIFFEMKELGDGFILSCPIGNTIHEIPFGAERAKLNKNGEIYAIDKT